MKSVATRLLTVVGFATTLAIAGIAQDKPATSITNDPRGTGDVVVWNGGHTAIGNSGNE